jgi:hypothetical protein
MRTIVFFAASLGAAFVLGWLWSVNPVAGALVTAGLIYLVWRALTR